MSELDVRGIGMTSQRTRDRLVQRLQDKGVKNAMVLAAIARVPRHLFVDEALAHRAYEDDALPIGFGQTISQPYIVARMTEALFEAGRQPRKVLEVGSGSGYQAAILGQLIDKVYTVERIEGLYRRTYELFMKLDIRNVRMKHTDGTWGWPEIAPFDAIVVTAAPDKVPEALLQQLQINGRLVIPVGAQGEMQELKVITRTDETTYEEETMASVNFVPFCPGELR